MTRRRLAVVTLIMMAPLLGDGRAARPHRRPQEFPDGCEGLQLSEFLPRPLQIDWNGDGNLDQDDEWIELHNAGDTPCDLLNWALDDNSSTPYTITRTTIIAPGGYLVFYRHETGIDLHGGSDCVRLFSPGAELPREQFCYNATIGYDASFCRPGGAEVWEWPCPPTPGRANDGGFRCYLPLVTRGD